MSNKVATEMSWECQGCQTRIRIEYVSSPTRTGAMSTVDCPLCGTNKMIPDTAERIYHMKDNQWIESKPHPYFA